MNNPLNLLARIISAQLSRSEYLYLHFFYYRNVKHLSESSCNVDHDRKLVFVHNPKAAGTSIKRTIGITEKGADHRTPTYLVHPKTWESYVSFVVVRNPFDRLVSAYTYHTSPDYRGFYYLKYPHLHDLSIEDYFDLMENEPWAIRPQVDYVEHRFSDKKADFLCHFENLEQEIEPVFQRLGVTSRLTHANRSSHEIYRRYYKDRTFKAKVHDFYQADLYTFGYVF